MANQTAKTNRCNVNINSALLIFCGIGFALAGSSNSALAEGPSLPALHFAPPTTQKTPAVTNKNAWRPTSASAAKVKSVAFKPKSKSTVKQTVLSQRWAAQQKRMQQTQAVYPQVYSPVTHSLPQTTAVQTSHPTTAPQPQPVYHAYAMSNELSACADGSCDSCESCEEESAFKKYCKRRWPGETCWDRWVREPWRKAYALQPAGCCESKGWYKYE